MNESTPSRLIEAALEIQGFCEHRPWPFCFIGGIAVLHWGEARLTRDADLTIFTGIGREQYFIEELLTQFESRIEDAPTFALEHRVLLLYATNGIPVNLSLGALPFEESAVRDATMQEITPGVELKLCSPAALVVYKVFAGRPQDWLDVEGIVVRRRREIDWAHVRQELGQLLQLKKRLRIAATAGRLANDALARLAVIYCQVGKFELKSPACARPVLHLGNEYLVLPSPVTCHRLQGLSILHVVGKMLSFASMRTSDFQP